MRRTLAIGETLPTLDPLSIDEMFALLLGYRIAKAPRIKVQIGAVLQDAKGERRVRRGSQKSPM